MVNSEKKLQFRILFKLLIAVAFAFLYAWGGMEFKFLRRIIAPAVLCGGMFLFSWNWRCLIQFPLMMITLSLGYGADSLIVKIVKRFIFGLANGTSSSVVNIFDKKWLLVIVQIILITGAYIVFGVFNPLPSARAEESLLGILIPLIPLLSLKDK
jgi:hypothetical protein